MIYSNKCYNKLVTLLEKEKVKFNTPIDILISKNYIQTTYSYGNIFYQREDWSDIEKRDNHGIKYLDYQKSQEILLMDDIKQCIMNKTIDYTIGIYTIFIGDYTIF